MPFIWRTNYFLLWRFSFGDLWVCECVWVVMMLSYQDESQVSASCRCRLITHCSPGQDICLLQLASKAHRNMRGSDVVCHSNLNWISAAWTWTVWRTHVSDKSEYLLAFCLKAGILSHLCENCMFLSKSVLKSLFYSPHISTLSWYALAQLVEALRYMLEGRRFGSQWGSLRFFIHLLLLAALWLWGWLSL